jgi:uncharacterized protein (TIGR03067 family)
MLHRTFLTLCLVGPLLAGDDPGKANPDEVRRRFYQCWLEIERVDSGVTTRDPNNLCGVQFGEGEYWVWGRRGELAAGGGTTHRVRIDPTARPMRVDIFSGTRDVPPGKRETVQLGIFKFEGDKLIVAVAPWYSLEPPAKGKDYPERPKEFRSTRENKVMLSTYTPTEFYGVD